MNFVINTREAKNERPHVHVTLGKGRGQRSLKVWIDCEKIEEVHNVKGVWPVPKINAALSVINANRQDMMEEWIKIHGVPRKRTR